MVEMPSIILLFITGKIINLDRGLFKTNQYALYKIFYDRMLLDRRRTTRPKSAAAFFIPYDFGTDAALHYDHGIRYKNHNNY